MLLVNGIFLAGPNCDVPSDKACVLLAVHAVSALLLAPAYYYGNPPGPTFCFRDTSLFFPIRLSLIKSVERSILL